MKKILILAIVLILSACSKDNLKDINKGQPIDFRMAVTKAEHTTLNLESFKVIAFKDDGEIYFKDVVFNNEGGTFKSTTSYYWPVEGNLHFCAYTGCDHPEFEFDIKMKSISVKVSGVDASSGDTDIIVAKAKGNKKDNEESGIELLFEHQLSKVEIRVQNTNESYKYSIKGVRIANVYGSGSLDDSKNVVWETGGKDASGNDVSKFTYKYQIEEDGNPVPCSEEPIMLKNWIVIPQTTEEWQEKKSSPGSYVSLLMQINQVVSNNDGEQTLRRVYPPITEDENDDEFQWVATPIAFSWSKGYKYIYTIDLGNGGGITDPEIGGNQEPQPIFGGEIRFYHNDVYVKDWSGNGQSVNLY